jgi:hypothetical protein
MFTVRPHALEAPGELCFFGIGFLPEHLLILLYIDTSHSKKILSVRKCIFTPIEGTQIDECSFRFCLFASDFYCAGCVPAAAAHCAAFIE